MVVLLVTEAATMQFVSIWFAGGALVTAIATMCGANELWQISIFVVGSGILLVLTRPFAKRISESQKNAKTNFDRVVGEKVIITEEVDNINSKGKAVINGVEWKVKSSSGNKIEEGKIVTVEKIEGVKLIVSE